MVTTRTLSLARAEDEDEDDDNNSGVEELTPTIVRSAFTLTPSRVVPSDYPMNAAEEDGTIRDLIESVAAVAVPLLATPVANPCRRLELLLLGASVLAPLLTADGESGGLLLQG